MIRLLIILIIFVTGYGALFYLFNNAGNLSLVLGIWQLGIPIVQFLFVLITFIILLILFSYAFTKLFIYPRAAYMRYKSSNEQKGLEHLRDALVAITEGNTDKAAQSQKKFKKYLGRDPLNKILQTQIKKTIFSGLKKLSRTFLKFKLQKIHQSLYHHL